MTNRKEGAMKADTKLEDCLTHRSGCPKARIETTVHPAKDVHPDITTVHCLDCGSNWPPDPEVSGPLAGAHVAGGK